MKKESKLTIQKEWNLSQLYKSPSDPQMEKDLSFVEKVFSVFVKKYKKTNAYMTSAQELLKALVDYEKLMNIPSSRPYFYLKLSQDIHSGDEKVRAKMNLVHERLQKLENTILFFSINLSKIDKVNQKKFLTDPRLKKYKYHLQKIFNESKYLLSEPEEKILSLKSLPSHSLWVKALEKLENKETVEHKGKKIPLSEATYLIKDLPTQAERQELHTKVAQAYMNLADVAESELNAIIIDKKINDELRGFDLPYDSTILAYENNRKSVLNLVQTVTNSFSLSQRFYKIKAKMLGLKKLRYADRAVSVGSTQKKINFEESYQILSRVFTEVDPAFGEILTRFVENGQIDAYPKVGKSGGAYCADDHQSPTFVLLNHTDSFESLMTFAHEMGHATHSEFSNTQSPLYETYSMATAETASTLFELFVFYDQFAQLSDDEKIIALHDKIQDDIQTIFRQIACFNLETDLHQTIRTQGNMTHKEMAECMNKHMKAYLGDFNLTLEDGYFFVGWPHLRYFFYVYSYAFGQLVSKALYKKYSEDKTYIEKIKQFLSLGGSMSPEDIFKSIGIDLLKPDFFKNGIQSIEEDIVLLEKLVAKKKYS